MSAEGLWRKSVERFNDKQAKGILCTVAAAVIWVLASFVVQKVEDEGLSPFVLSYIANSLFVVFLPLDYFRKREDCWRKPYQRLEDEATGRTSGLQPGLEQESVGKDQKQLPVGYFEEKIFRAALVVAPLWFLAQFTFNTSLHMTSVTSNTILSNTSGLFTYALSWAMLQEKYVAHRLVSILVCTAGTSIFSFGDRGDVSRPNSIGGDALCLLSAVFYACYTVSIKKMLGEEENANMVLFFGYVGLINLVALAPFMLILSLTSVINVQNLTASMFGLVVAKGPTTATLGMSLQSPLAVALDILSQNVQHASTKSIVVKVLGGWFVLAGFVGITIPPKKRLPAGQETSQLEEL